jgi:hypothetical protein
MPESSPFSAEDFLTRHWSAIAARLGDRRGAFLQLVESRARERGFADGVLAARFANLCFAFGTGFETRPENEWALAILLDDRLTPWVKLHQLAVRGAAELNRRSTDGAMLAAQLLATDGQVIDAFDPLLRAGTDMVAIAAADRVIRPRVACDIEAVELRVLDNAWRQEYHLAQGQWMRRPVTAAAPLRVDAQHAPPERFTLLTRSGSDEAPCRLQVRQVHHGRCGLGLHPAVRWSGSRESVSFKDEGARSAAWPVSVPTTTEAPHLLVESWPEISLVQLSTCGLRDEGVPRGSFDVQLWAYAAHQWLLQLQRDARLGFALPDPKSSPPAVKPTVCKLERDGATVPADAWVRGFDESLRAALAQGFQRLLEVWQPNVQDATLQADIGLFDGKAAMTWGLREGARGLASPPVQRVVADLDWTATGTLHLQGKVEYAGARAHLHLRIDGTARQQVVIERLHADVDLLAAMQGAVLRWRWPVQLDYDPVADDDGSIFSEVGPCSGALTGSLGLRPTVTGGGGWEWFATLAIEPVATRVVVHDPLLGRSESHMALLGSVSLLDWSLA